MVFYAVANGRNIGIFLNWNDCDDSIKNYKNAIYKKLKTKDEAEQFINKYNENYKQKNIIDFNPDYYVYTDGACSNNGKANAVAGIGIYFGIDDSRNVSKKIEGKQTNNTAELGAIIETYYIIENDLSNGKKIAIISDSEYAIKCVTSYGEKCYKKDWAVNIPNKELVKTAYDMYKNKPNIKFIHIRAHTNNTDLHSIGNHNADKLANLAIGFNNTLFNKIYLIVPFSRKDEIKQLGGQWSSNKKKWFVYDNNKNLEQILNIFSKE
jgi:ribonuclease HI